MPCELVYKCPTCHKFVEHHEMKPEVHKCGHFTCKSCRQYVDPEHLCYARSYPPSEDGNRRFIFADIETSQKDEKKSSVNGDMPLALMPIANSVFEKKRPVPIVADVITVSSLTAGNQDILLS